MYCGKPFGSGAQFSIPLLSPPPLRRPHPPGGPPGWPPRCLLGGPAALIRPTQIFVVFPSPVVNFVLSSPSWRSFRGIVAAVQGHGPTKSRVWASLGSLCGIRAAFQNHAGCETRQHRRRSREGRRNKIGLEMTQRPRPSHEDAGKRGTEDHCRITSTRSVWEDERLTFDERRSREYKGADEVRTEDVLEPCPKHQELLAHDRKTWSTPEATRTNARGRCARGGARHVSIWVGYFGKTPGSSLRILKVLRGG